MLFLLGAVEDVNLPLAKAQMDALAAVDPAWSTCSDPEAGPGQLQFHKRVKFCAAQVILGWMLCTCWSCRCVTCRQTLMSLRMEVFMRLTQASA